MREFMIAMNKLFLILLFIFLPSISFSQFQKSFNQTSSINITGNASTIVQSEIDARLNVNGDGLTWDVTEAPFQIAPLRNSTMSGDTSPPDAWVTSTTVTAGTASYGYNSTGGNPAPSFFHKATSAANKAADILFITNQTFNYTFGLPASVTLSWDYQVIGNSFGTGNRLNVTLVRPDGAVVTLDTVTFTAAVDWTRRTINVGTGNFSQTGTYVIQLRSNLVAAAKGTSNFVQSQWDNVFLNFTFYTLSVEHNTTVSYQGTLQNISFFVNFSSTTNKNYNISIYDFLNNKWVSCQNISASANTWYGIWCNISSNPSNYVSSDKKIRVRINSTMDYNQATLKEEYVQFYLYSCYPIWKNQQQSTNKPAIGAKVNLSTFWQDCVALDKAWLSTNETGTWKNYTDIYLINFNGATSGWSNFTWQNSSLPTGTIVAWRIYANDTFGNENTTSIMTFEIRPTYLLVNLTFPEPEIYNDNSPLLVNQNTTFMVNSTVLCFSDGDGAVCQNVSGTIRYNATSLNPDTPISKTYGAAPFFINETPANSTKLCGTLNQNQICNLSWVINATGNVNSAWKIGVLFNSSYTNIPQNHTKNATLLISTCIIDISLKFSSIDFGNVLPNTVGNPAIGNNNNIYNITVNPGSCNVDLYINSTDLVNNTFNSKILAGNLSFNNVTNNYSTSFRFDYLWKLIRSNVPASTNLTLWFWLDVPPIYAGYYLGTLFVKAVSVGAKP